MKLAREVQLSKAPIQRLADKVVNFFVPIVVVIAIAAFVVWYLVFNNGMLALTCFVSVLVIACPCALGIATPTAIMIGVSKGAENGILIKNSAVLEIIGKLDTVVFDKTGTLTKGKLEVIDIVAENKKHILKIAVLQRKGSNIQLAKQLLRKLKMKESKSPNQTFLKPYLDLV